MTEQANTGTKSQKPADPWANAPDAEKEAPLFPFITPSQRAELVNTRAILRVIDMEYDSAGTFGARFVATFLAPDDNAYKYGFKTNKGKTPRDVINKWIWEQINKEHVNPVPVVLCKRANSYYFDRPGTASETDTSAGAPGLAHDTDVPDF